MLAATANAGKPAKGRQASESLASSGVCLDRSPGPDGAGGAAGGDEAGSGGAKQAVIAFNQADGAHLPRSGVMVAPVAGDSVEPENLAYARSSCSNCRTVAVAFQAVVVTGSPSVARPKNAAVAANVNCTSCQTMADAYQYVVTASGPVA